MLLRLVSGEATVTELARPFDLTQPAISNHIRVLESAGLIARRAEGTRRLCRLSPEAFASLEQWIEQLRKSMSANYDRLDLLLASQRPPDKEKNE